MLTIRLRQYYEKASIPFGKASLRLGLTPNFWTMTSLFAAALAGLSFGLGFIWWGLLAMLVMLSVTLFVFGVGVMGAGQTGKKSGIGFFGSLLAVLAAFCP